MYYKALLEWKNDIKIHIKVDSIQTEAFSDEIFHASASRSHKVG